jgi:hypothetical protein
MLGLGDENVFILMKIDLFMNWKRGLGIVLLFVGIGLSFTSRIILGAVIGFNHVSYSGMLGILVFIAGIFLIYSETLEGLVKASPGKGIKGDYIRLADVFREGSVTSNKVDLAVRGNQIYRTSDKGNLRPIQGLMINGDSVVFLGEHYTSHRAADIIEKDRSFLRKNSEDPYVYFLEPLDRSSMSEQEIRHQIGSSSATDVVRVRVSYPLDRVYLKVEKGRPTHIAIDGDVTPEHLIKNKGRYIMIKKIQEMN